MATKTFSFDDLNKAMQKESKPQPTNLSDKIRCSDPHFYLHFQGTKGYETEQKQTKQ